MTVSGLSRKGHVLVPQDRYVALLADLDHDDLGGGWVCLADIAEHLDVHPSTARRQLDGLVVQGRCEVAPGRLRSYRIAGV